MDKNLHSQTGTHLPHERVIDLCYAPFLVPGIPYYLYEGWKRTTSTKDLITALLEKFGLYSGSRIERGIWIHAASVGEVRILPPLLTQLSETNLFETHKRFITSNTFTGVRTAREELPHIHSVHYSPVDISWIIRRTFQQFSPRMILLVEQELWPNLCYGARQSNCPVFVINGRISQRSAHRLKKLPVPLKNVFRNCVDQFLVQNQTYKIRFQNAGIPSSKITVTGNMKYDATTQSLPGNDEIENEKTILQVSEEEGVIVAGSIHPPEHNLLSSTFRKLQEKETPHESLKLILAPRHPEKASRMQDELHDSGARSVRYRELREGAAPKPIIIIDIIGILKAIYALSDVVVIGGSFIEHGGQNVLEPAALGKPVLIGPHYFNFKKEVQFLNQAGGLKITESESHLKDVLEKLLSSPSRAKEMGANARNELGKHRGATNRTINHLLKHSKEPSE